MQWTIDPAHSQIEFAVKHMAISTVRGRFKRFAFDAQTDDAGDLVAVEATIDAASVDTNVEQRDAHLRSGDFLDAENHPTLVFRSTAIDRADEGEYRVTGDLTIRGTTKPVTFTLSRGQIIRDPYGNTRVAAEGTGKLSRKEWGLNWNQALELGGVLVSDEVRFTIEVQAVAVQGAAIAA